MLELVLVNRPYAKMAAILFIFAPKNEVSKANLNANKRILNCQPFLHRVYK